MKEINSTSNDAYVRKFSFRPYEGTRRGRIYRLWAIAWQWWAHEWERSRAVKILIGFLVFTLVLTNLFLLSMKDMMLLLDPTLTTNKLLEDNLINLIRGLVTFQTSFETGNGEDPGDGGMSFNVGGMSIFVLILCIVIGSGLIADDVSNKTNEIYYAKLEKYEYVLGKFGAFFLFGNIVITLPYVFEFFLLVIGIGNIDIIEALPVLFHVIIFTEIIILTYAAIILALSSLTQRRLYAGLTAFMLLFIMNMIVPALAFNESGEVGLQLLFDVLTVLLLTSYILCGTTTVNVNLFGWERTINLTDGVGIEAWMVLVALVIYILLGITVVLFQVFWKHKQ